MNDRRRSWWGWGWEDQTPDPAQTRAIAGVVAERFGLADLEIHPPVGTGRPGRCPPPAWSPRRRWPPCARRARTTGPATPTASRYRDIVRNVRGDLAAPARRRGPTRRPRPTSWPCSTGARSVGAAVIPYGGGSSVVGGVEADVGDGYAGAVSIDLTALDRVVEIDRTSRAARIQGGALGPVLEDQLRPHGLTLRHFPQSFEFSTLGRLAGHPLRRPLRQSVYTHIDDLVESMRVVTPRGRQRVPTTAGLGRRAVARPLVPRARRARSGIITEAWMRLQDRPGPPRARRRCASPTWRAGPKRSGRSRRRRCSRRTAACSTRRGRGVGGHDRRVRRARARLRVGATTPWAPWLDIALDDLPRPRRDPARAAALPIRGRRRGDRRRVSQPARSRRGATPSCGRRTGGTRWWP